MKEPERGSAETVDQPGGLPAARRLLDLWRRGKPPSLEAFLAASGPLPADELVAVVRVDQRERWERGDRPPAEEYLRLEPVAAAGADVALDLICCEVMVRGDLHEAPTLDEYLKRFPALADPLRRLFAVNQALESSCVTSETADGNPPAAPGAALPATVGKYRIVTALGAGGQATAYRAVHPVLGKDVVLKLSHGALGPDAAARDRLVAEGRVLAELDHPHLARVYDLDIHEGRVFLVMEYVPGRNLEQYARQEPPSPRQAAGLVACMARALAAVHRRGILHLDVKPRNIVIDAAGAPRLIDFGMARLQNAYGEERIVPGTVSGTVTYMPPEQASGRTDLLGPRSDLFALGGVLYFLLTGRGPYQGHGFEEALARAREGDWDRSPLQSPPIPQALAAVCKRALAPALADRYASGEDMAADLERFAGRRRPRWLLALGAAALLIVAATAWRLGWGGDQPEAGKTNAVPPAPGTEVGRQALGVRVWRNDRFLDLPDALPLVRGDELKVEAKIPAGFHAALLWYTSEGKTEWLGAAAAGDAPARLHFSAELDKVAGTEVLLLCGRRSGPVDRAMLEALVSATGRLPTLPGQPLYQLGPGGSSLVASKDVPDQKMALLKKLGGKGRGFVTARDRDDPAAALRHRLDDLCDRLREPFELLDGLAFPHSR